MPYLKWRTPKNDLFSVDNIIYSLSPSISEPYFTKCFIIICNIADSDLQTSSVIQFMACNLQLDSQRQALSHAHHMITRIIIGDISNVLDKVGLPEEEWQHERTVLHVFIDY